jgi:molybdate transport system ATP-binding protein
MTLKCIAGIETPDEGYISVNGRVLFDSVKKINLKPQERRVGYLFQNYALFPRMTALENIRTGLPKPGREEKTRFWIERMGLTGLEDRLPSRLSGGQQQRVALARMLIRAPDVILLDEPFSALDSALREQMQLLLLDLIQREGAFSPLGQENPPSDAVMVTHSRDEAYKICDSLLVMEDGRILGRGRTRELFADPRSLQAARITGCKNISPIKRTGDREIFALNWGLRLVLPRPVPEGITHAGIRAHDFLPLRTGDDARPNQISVKIKRRSEEPFEEAVLFTNADAASPEEEQELWWKFSKYLGLAELPRRLYVPPEAVLLLK